MALGLARGPSWAYSDRVAFVALPRDGERFRAAQGLLDAEAVAERLRQADGAFEIVTIAAHDDLAGQIDDHFAERSGQAPHAVLFYASARTTASDGELLLQLDPEHLETGDALCDIVEALTESSRRPAGAATLIVLELRHESSDPLALAEYASLARDVARRTAGAVELIVVVGGRALGAEGEATACSPFTHAMLAELDETDPSEGLYASELVERVRPAVNIAGAFAHAAVTESFPVLVAEERPLTLAGREPEDGAPGALAAEGRASSTSSSAEASQPTPEAGAQGHARQAPVDDARARAAVAAATSGSSSASTRAPALAEAGSPAPRVSIPPARPSIPPVAKDVLAEGDDLASVGRDEDALLRYRKALSLVGAGLVASEADEERARIYLRMGDVRLRQGNGREAIASYEKSISLGPSIAGAERALKTLHTLHVGEGDRQAVHAVEERILGRLDDDAEVVATLMAFGRAWMIELHDPLRARERFEHAQRLAPGNREAVRLLLQLAKADGRSEDELTLKRSFADLEPEPKARAALLFALGRELHEKGREDEALDLLDAALDVDPAGLEPLAVMSSLLGERQEWGELEGAYRRMLERASRMPQLDLRRGLEHELHKRLALLLLQHLEAPEAALVELELASKSRPTDVAAHRAVVQTAHRLGRSTTAEQHLLAIATLEPRDLEALHLLFDSFVRSEDIERAGDVASVLVQLKAAGDRERVVFGAREKDERGVRGALTEDDWVQLRAPIEPGSDEAAGELVAGVFHAAGDMIVRSFAQLAARASKLVTLDESLRVDPELTTVSAARCVAWASRVLGMRPPAVYLEEGSPEGMFSVLRAEPVTVIGADALRGRSLDELRFIAGYHLTGHLPAHRVVRLCPSIDDLAACFLAAVVIAVPDTPVPERIRSLVELLVPTLAANLDEERELQLEEAVMAFDAAGGRADLLVFQRSVERAALRAGLLLCDSLDAAVRGTESLAGGALSKEERQNELLAFTISDQLPPLRARLR